MYKHFILIYSFVLYWIHRYFIDRQEKFILYTLVVDVP